VARELGFASHRAALRRANTATIDRTDCSTRPDFDRIPALAPKVAAERFDTGANVGTGTAASFLR
jgi:hypothetical protein